MEKAIKGFLLKNIFISILFLLFGIVLIMFPNMSTMALAYSAGILLIANGVGSLISKERKTLIYDPVIIGVISLIFGIVIFINPDVFNTIVPVLLGIWFIILGIIKYEIANILNEIGENGWGGVVATALLTIVAGFLLILCPKIGANVLIIFMGTLIMLYSISDIINYILIRNKVSKLAKYFK